MKILTIFSLVFLILGFVSCRQTGCCDPEARNFNVQNEECKPSECRYDSTIVTFYTDDPEPEDIWLYFPSGGDLLGRFTERYNAKPDCHSRGCITVKLPNRVYSYDIEDSDGSYKSGSIQLQDENKCRVVKINI